MSNTGKPFVNFAHNKLVELEDLKDRFFEYLDTQLKGAIARVYNNPGVFDSLLALTSPGNDQFSITGTSLATDGVGNIIDVNGDFANCQTVQFENESAVDYEVALHVAEGPMLHSSDNTIVVNANTGAPEYLGLMNYIGEKGDPDSVDILGSNITLAIDSLCEVGVSHAGRSAIAYLKSPSATDSDVGLPVLEVQFVAGENVVVIESTLLGQTVASTDPTDYEVIVLGPTVRRNSSNEGVEGYVLMGEVTGSGAGTTPTTFVTSQQDLISVSLSEINNAFANFVSEEGPSSSGAGPKEVWDSSTQYGYSASAIVGEEMFVFGGVTGYAGSASFSTQVQIYDIDADSWSSGTSLSTALCGMAALARNSTIFVAGGHNGSGAVTTVRRYDASTDTWLADAASLPAARAYGSLVMSDDGRHIYYVGGSSHAHNAAAAVEDDIFVYDVDADSWSTESTIPSTDPAGGPNVVLVDDIIYILGGTTQINASTDGEASEVCLSYNLGTEAWTTLTDAPLRLSSPSTGVYSPGGVGYKDVCAVYGKPFCFHYRGLVHLIAGDRPTFAMGTNPDHPSIGGKHSTYSILNNEWTVMPKLKCAARYASASAILDGVVYTFKGLPKETSGIEINGRESDAFAIDFGVLYSSDSPGAVFSSVDNGSSFNEVAVSLYSSDMQEDRTRFASVKFCGGILVSGGINDAGNPLDTSEVFWPQTNTSQVLPVFPSSTTRYDHKMVVIPSNDEETVFVLPGKTTAGANTVNANIFVLKASNLHGGWWQSTTLTSAPDRSAYAVGQKGNLVFIIGGVNSSGVSPSYISTYDLETNVHVNDAILAGETWSVPTSSVQFEDTVYVATTTSGSEKFLKFNLSQNIANTNDYFSPVLGTSAYFASDLEQPGLAVWNGNVYLFNPDDSQMDIYNSTWLRTPGGTVEPFHDMVAFASFGSNPYGAEMQIVDGMIVRMGGSTTTTYSTADTEILVHSIGSGYLQEDKPQITNFKTGQSGESVGFKAGQPFGSICYDSRQLPSYILMGNDVN